MAKTEDLLKPLREQIYEKMRRMDWSLLHLSVVCGISDQTLRNVLCRKNNNISFSTIVKLSEGTGIPVTTLISGEKHQRKKGRCKHE